VALAEHFSDRQVLDVIVIHGAYVILGCMLNSWPVELDQQVAAVLPKGCTRERFEREISGG
jgi:hypothetical protein